MAHRVFMVANLCIIAPTEDKAFDYAVDQDYIEEEDWMDIEVEELSLTDLAWMGLTDEEIDALPFELVEGETYAVDGIRGHGTISQAGDDGEWCIMLTYEECIKRMGLEEGECTLFYEE